MLRLLLFILLCCHVTAERYAYLFFATSKAHVCAVRSMIHQIKYLGSRAADFIVISEEDAYFEDDIIVVGMDNQILSSNVGYYRHSFQKFQAFKMTQYDRIIWLDADSLLMKPIDHLFDLPTVSVAAPIANWENEMCVTSALMIITPSIEVWNTLIVPNLHKYVNRADMDLLNEVYEHRIGDNRILPEMLVLPSKYLTLTTEFTYPEPYNNDEKLWKDVYVFHFSGAFGKPWNINLHHKMNENTKNIYNMYKRSWVC